MTNLLGGIKMKINSINTRRCPLISMCNCKTAVCSVSLPDEGCYWYRWFKERIKNVEHNKRSHR